MDNLRRTYCKAQEILIVTLCGTSLFLESSLCHLKYFLDCIYSIFLCLNFSVPEFYPQLLTPWVLVGGIIFPIYILDFPIPISYLKSRQIALFGQLAISIWKSSNSTCCKMHIPLSFSIDGRLVPRLTHTKIQDAQVFK